MGELKFTRRKMNFKKCFAIEQERWPLPSVTTEGTPRPSQVSPWFLTVWGGGRVGFGGAEFLTG